MKKIKAWHFVSQDRKLKYDGGMGLEAVPGYIYSEDAPKLEMCRIGLHASRSVRDALTYAPGLYLCRVEMWGDVEEGDDKLVARHRHVVAAADATKVVQLWACWCVRQQWDLLTDARSRAGVEVAERYIRGEATKDEMNAAANAAANAANAANAAYANTAYANATANAAYANTAYANATANAANAAAYATANAAYAAAAYANAAAAYANAANAAYAANAKKKQDEELERRMKALLGVE